MAAVWWCLIFVSIALIIKSPWQAWLPEKAATGDERVSLAVLELQGRFLLGAAQTKPEDLERQLTEMEGMAVTDHTAAAVAAVRFFIDPEGNGKWRALALVNARLKDSDKAPGKATGKEPDESTALLQQVRKALSGTEPLNEAGREQIRSQMGWFGKVLLSAGVAEGEPGAEEAAALRMQAITTVFITGILALVVFLGALLGLGLLVAGLIALKNGKLELRGVATEIPAQPYLGAFALYLALMVLADFLSITLHPLIAIAGMFVSVGIAFFWPRIRGLGWRDCLRGYGWRRGKGVLHEMAAGVVGYVAMAPVFALGLCATLILTLISGWLASQGADPEELGVTPRPVTHPVIAWVADGDWKVKLAVLFLASGLAPLFEETMFRGALYGVFRKRWGFVVSGLASGVIFAAVHPQGFLAIPALTAMGFGFALIREWRGTLIASMTAHSLHNGILVSVLLLALS